METPDTEAGRLTEKIMQNLRKKLPDMRPHEYNPIWSSVLETLQIHFKEKETSSVNVIIASELIHRRRLG